VGWLCPGFGDVDALSQDHFFDEINASGADFLMAALGARNGQLWLQWLWRIKEEPSLFRRYWHDGGVFVTLLFSHILPLAIRAHNLNLWAGRYRQDFVIFPIQNDDDNVTVSLVGYATASRVPEAISCFRQAVASKKSIVVDLSQTRTIDARFFGLLLMLRKQLKRTGSTLQFQGVTSGLHGLFRLNALEYLLSSG
jgi:N-acetylglucosaminyldiphosphoundecaprenol N-acetyl-beta-D-mannosaminyltransferase